MIPLVETKDSETVAPLLTGAFELKETTSIPNSMGINGCCAFDAKVPDTSFVASLLELYAVDDPPPAAITSFELVDAMPWIALVMTVGESTSDLLGNVGDMEGDVKGTMKIPNT